ncbi:MAG: hypothetical protein ACLUQJ_01240 [Alphaproteobacteria bacterium]
MRPVRLMKPAINNTMTNVSQPVSRGVYELVLFRRWRRMVLYRLQPGAAGSCEGKFILTMTKR